MLSPGADRQTRGSSLFLRPGKLKEASRRDFHSPSATDRHRQGTSSHYQESYLDLGFWYHLPTQPKYLQILTHQAHQTRSAFVQQCWCPCQLCLALREIEEEKNYDSCAHLAEEKIIATVNMSLNIKMNDWFVNLNLLLQRRIVVTYVTPILDSLLFGLFVPFQNLYPCCLAATLITIINDWFPRVLIV